MNLRFILTGIAVALALASCGKPEVPKKAEAKTEQAVPLPRPRAAAPVAPARKVVRKRAVRSGRILRISCEKVHWYYKNVPERVILAIEDQDVLLRGLTLAQKAQQRREARACLRR